MPVNQSVRVSVAFALPGRAWQEEITLAAGATVGEAVEASGLAEVCHRETGELPAGYGVFGRNVRPDEALVDGQRVEVYRALELDPRARRRQRERG